MAKKAQVYDPTEFLKDAESQAELLADAFSTGDAGHIADAIGLVAKAKGITEVARNAALTRATLYKAFSKDGDPRLTTLTKTLKALNFELTVKTLDPA